MEEALTAQLLASSSLTALVGDRISWTQRRQGDGWPAVVLTLVSSVPEYDDGGFSGLRKNRVQIDCWAVDDQGVSGATQAILVARAVRAALASASMTVLGVEFQAVIPDEDGIDSAEQGLAGVVEFRRRLEFLLWNVEPLGG